MVLRLDAERRLPCGCVVGVKNGKAAGWGAECSEAKELFAALIRAGKDFGYCSSEAGELSGALKVHADSQLSIMMGVST